MTVLDRLRLDPSTTIREHGFLTEVPQGTNGKGGRCTLSVESLKSAGTDKVYKITAKDDPGGRDYYFPYVGGAKTDFGQYVGDVIVSNGEPDGTLVVTGGMNGCSLQVDGIGEAYCFKHIMDGKVPVNKDTICRVDYRDYGGPASRKKALGVIDIFAESKAMMLLRDKEHISNGQHSLICIKKQSRWYVYDSIIYTLVNDRSDKRYVVCRNPITTLITSFD